jgi:hypothetical protein
MCVVRKHRSFFDAEAPLISTAYKNRGETSQKAKGSFISESKRGQSELFIQSYDNQDKSKQRFMFSDWVMDCSRGENAYESVALHQNSSQKSRQHPMSSRLTKTRLI